jgi:hypothetical protein
MSSRRYQKHGFRTKSGAVKVQVLLHPDEYKALARSAKREKVSISRQTREIVAFHFAYPGGSLDFARKTKYQPRGFART